MKKFDQVRAEDTVFCLVNGYGRVVELQVNTKGELFQIIVLFSGISISSDSIFKKIYNLDGKCIDYSAPTLFWKEPNTAYVTDNPPRRRYTKTYYAALDRYDVIGMFTTQEARNDYVNRNSGSAKVEEPIKIEYIK